jgi:hypothetical protein
MLIYKCNNCEEETDKDQKITLGSKNNSLYFTNEVEDKDRRIMTISNNYDMHFCNKKCFIKYFFANR